MKIAILFAVVLVGTIGGQFTGPGPSCEAIRCAAGSECVLGHCVPTQQNPCAVMRCAIGSQCVVIETCRKGTCTSVGECQPIQDACPTMKCATGSECVLGVCQPTQKDCDDIKCASNEECVMVDVDCVQGPCYPVPECRPKPFPGSTCDGMQCPNQCAMVLPANCDGRDCTPSAQCVDANPCHWTRCSLGYQCVLQESECDKQPHAVCVPTNTDVQSCLNVKCHTAAGCAMVNPLSCAHDKNCQQIAICIEENPCHWTKCSLGFECVLQQVFCEEEPCNPVAVCEMTNVVEAPL